MNWDLHNGCWRGEPVTSRWAGDALEIVTAPETDLWQRTGYGSACDNAPAYLWRTGEAFFTFSFETAFEPSALFDQCGLLVYQNSENWCKASIEYENADIQRLGSVVTNHGYSDWATTDIPSSVRRMSYRLSRRESDFYLESAEDGVHFQQMRLFHLFEGAGDLSFGVYACSPNVSSFTAHFTNFSFGPCQWSLA